MANTYKNSIANITATGSDEVVYTCPSNATAIINTIFVYNRAGGSAAFTLKLTDTSASSSTTIYYNSALANLTTDIVLGSGNVVVLEDSDILKINTDAQPVDVTSSILQITRA